MTTFSLPWANPDLDIHPNPPEGWDRVAVVCGWSDAKKARERWPHAAVVGPLRTLRGLDLFVRGLLANPQVRVLIWDGPDLTPGEATKTALFALWHTPALDAGRLPAPLGVDMHTHLDTLRRQVGLVTCPTNFVLPLVPHDALIPGAGLSAALRAVWPGGVLAYDRPGGPVILPPPAPTSSERALHGDPGDRIAADTLADLWPRALARVLRCGREVETQHGGTRELLNLVSVIRDPGKTLADFPSWAESGVPEIAAVAAAQPHPVLGFSFADAEAYAERLTGAAVPEGSAYSYGSRLRGCGSSISTVRTIIQDTAVACRNVPGLLPAPAIRLAEMANVMEALTTCIMPMRDQIEAQEALLAHDPRTRAAYLTPWRPEEDASKESGRPCLVGVWFRAIDGALHMTVTFRSHDLYGAFGLNLAACCLWLVRLADKLGMAAGTLTCLSMSAHVYARDLADAQKVVAAYKPPPGPRWDHRTAWRAELVRAETVVSLTDTDAILRSWLDRMSAWETDMNDATVADDALDRVAAAFVDHPTWTPKQPRCYLIAGRDSLFVREAQRNNSLKDRALTAIETERLIGLVAQEVAKLPPMPGPPIFSLRASALTPDGAEVLQVFEAKTPEKLLRDIGESGLITETGSALWLGREVERVWAGRKE